MTIKYEIQVAKFQSCNRGASNPYDILIAADATNCSSGLARMRCESIWRSFISSHPPHYDVPRASIV